MKPNHTIHVSSYPSESTLDSSASVARATGRTQTIPQNLMHATGIDSMPMEIHGEVCGTSSYKNMGALTILQVASLLAATPKDLISFSTASRSVHRSLSCRLNARHIWLEALSTIKGLPPCPAHLSERTFLIIILVVLHNCFGCLKPCKADIDWDLSVRLCPRCSSKQIVFYDERRPPTFMPEPTVKLYTLIPVRSPTLRCGFLKSDLAAITAKFKCLAEAERAAFLKQRRELMVQVRTHARLCREWEDKLVTGIKGRRKQVIHKKLFSLGWGDELAAMPADYLDSHRLVDQRTEFTETEWVGIQPAVEAHMQAFRDQQAADKTQALRREAKTRLAAAKRKDRTAKKLSKRQ
ncbi:hypothetical protein B0H11DRAFT_1002290 [Mycena galericulata]|nr:hypothetical protein B0H11DRAFT_1002290 [Mycena galericulata]